MSYLIDTVIHPVSEDKFFFHCCLQLCYEFVIDTDLNEESVGADTGLPAVPELGSHGTGHSEIEIGGVEHDERSVATQLQGQFLDRAGALAVK